MDIWSALADFWNSMPVDIKTYFFYPLAVAVVTWYLARDRERAKTKKIMEQIQAGPSKYVAELDALIQNAVAEGRTNAIINARAIVKTRDEMRSSLTTITSLLNTEIDTLAVQIGSGDSRLQRPRTGASSEDAAYATIKVLAKVWPAKRTQIEIEIRKCMAELGLPITVSAPVTNWRFK